MLRIEVKSEEVMVKSGVSGRTGKAYTVHEQTAYWHMDGAPFPERIVIGLEANQAAYKPGMYMLAPGSFYIGKFNALMCRPKLVPFKATQAA